MQVEHKCRFKTKFILSKYFFMERQRKHNLHLAGGKIHLGLFTITQLALVSQRIFMSLQTLGVREV